MSPRKQRYLHHKLALSTLWLATMFAAIIAMVSFFAEFHRANEKNRIMLAQLLDTVENTAAIAAYAGNRAIGEDVLTGLMRNDIVHEVRLFSEQRLDLQQSRGGLTSAQGAITRTLHSPFGDSEPIGTLTVVPETRFSLREAYSSALLVASDSTAVVGLTAILLMVLVRNSLSRPLLSVSNTLHAIKPGEHQRLSNLPLHRDDELGQLVRDINGLLDAAQEKFEEERRLRHQIQAVERQLRDIFENTSAGIFLLNATGRLQTANPTLGRALGLPEVSIAEWQGVDFAEAAFADAEPLRALMRQADQSGQAVAADLQLKNPGAWVHCLLSRRIDAARGVHFEGVVYDITERRQVEMRVRHEADHDPLTGLYRRQAFERDLLRLLESPRSDGEGGHVILLLDLDNFKAINDTYGHAAGDTVLMETAQRLKSCVRCDDKVARLGGDEFAIVLVNCQSLERARKIARDLVVSVLQPIPLADEIKSCVGVSIGLASHDGQYRSMAELFEAADLAMYEVKRQGKSGYGLAKPTGKIAVERIERGLWTRGS
jgi:diguanylate cyclase (GGDEF)-like protein/PAS domain S-box-containing protein